MRFFNKKNKKVPNGKYRIIKIGKDALYEFLRESMIDNQEIFFDISDNADIVTCFDIDWNKGEFICIARNQYEENEKLQFEFDTEKLISSLNNTTNSLYTDNRYIELTEEEIDKICK